MKLCGTRLLEAEGLGLNTVGKAGIVVYTAPVMGTNPLSQ